MATEQAPPAQPPNLLRSAATRSTPPRPATSGRRPYFPLQGAVRRFASVAALVALDLVGLVLGVYAALTLREVVYGTDVDQWGLRWEVETDWLPFLTVITCSSSGGRASMRSASGGPGSAGSSARSSSSPW